MTDAFYPPDLDSLPDNDSHSVIGGEMGDCTSNFPGESGWRPSAESLLRASQELPEFTGVFGGSAGGVIGASLPSPTPRLDRATLEREGRRRLADIRGRARVTSPVDEGPDPAREARGGGDSPARGGADQDGPKGRGDRPIQTPVGGVSNLSTAEREVVARYVSGIKHPGHGAPLPLHPTEFESAVFHGTLQKHYTNPSGNFIIQLLVPWEDRVEGRKLDDAYGMVLKVTVEKEYDL